MIKQTNRERSNAIGMIGCGAIAEIYHLPALVKIPGMASRLWLVEPNPERLDAMLKKFPCAGGVADYRELEDRVGGVIIATPPATHYAIGKWFLERGIDVLCEKPLTENFEEAEDLVRLAREHDARLAVNQTRRFFPTYRKIRDLIASGAIGELRSIRYHDGVEFNWPAASPHHFAKDAKGAWSDTGVHLVDTICFWLGGETPELVESLNDSFGGPEAMSTVRLKHRECDIEVKVSRLGLLANNFKIIGTLGSIEANVEEFSVVEVRSNQGAKKTYRVGSRKLKYTDFAKPLLENFVQVVERKAEPIVSGESVLGTIRILESAYSQPKRYRMPWNLAMQRSIENQIKVIEPEMRVLVTGASGFVGCRVVECMMLTGIAKPLAAIRSWSRAPRIARLGAEVVICDIGSPEQVDRAVSQVDAIVHLAKTDDRESIVGGTRNLLESAVKHRVKRFVYLSTAEVYGPDVSGTITEAHTIEPTGRLYGDAKIEAEQVCREYHKRGLFPTILRPSLIYGPFSASWTIDIAKRLESNYWGTFEELGEGRANLIYVDDLVQAICKSLTNEAALGEDFHVNGPEVPTWNEYFERFNQALGRQPLPKLSASRSKLRTKLMDTCSYMADKVVNRFEDKLMEIYLRGGWPTMVMKRVKRVLQSTPSGAELNDLFSRNAFYSDAKARELIGYKPVFDLDEGLKLSVQWLQLNELLRETVSDQAEDWILGTSVDLNVEAVQS